MGNAQTSNVAQAVSNVANFVNQSTTANASQINELKTNVTFTQCVVDADKLEVNEAANLMQKNCQIVQAAQDTNLLNNIQQQMTQVAASKVGTLGIGYASANNSASELVNDTNSVMQSMTGAASQFSSTDQSFTCDRSYIKAKDFSINFSDTADFLSSQTLNQGQTTQIVNDISQSIKQKATATVEGIAGLILAILLILAIIIWALMKPLSTGAAKVGVGIAVCFLLVGIMVFMYIRECPPFFSEPNECVPNSSLGKGDDDNAECINLKPHNTSLSKTPLRYVFGLTPANDPNGTMGNLMQMAISALQNASKDNGGYRMDVANYFQTNVIPNYVQAASLMGVSSNIPNLLIPYNNNWYQIPKEYTQSSGSGEPGDRSGICTPKILQLSSGAQGTTLTCATLIDPVVQNFPTTTNANEAIANLNVQGWDDYLDMVNPPSISSTDNRQNRALFARFVLLDIIGQVDLSVYIFPNEIVKFFDPVKGTITDLAANHTQQCTRYTPITPPNDWTSGISGGGTVSGLMGVWNTNTYKFQNFMKNIGGYILASILGLTFIYMGYSHFSNKDKPESSGNSLVDTANQIAQNFIKPK